MFKQLSELLSQYEARLDELADAIAKEGDRTTVALPLAEMASRVEEVKALVDATTPFVELHFRQDPHGARVVAEKMTGRPDATAAECVEAMRRRFEEKTKHIGDALQRLAKSTGEA